MLHVNNLVGFGGGGEKESIYQIIARLGYTSGLTLCLDAADSLSYSSGQSWLDRSGGGYDFFRGATSSSEGTDPTFNGTVGANTENEYWSFDGGDYFTYDTTVETWMSNLHKDNATWSYIAGMRHPTGASNNFYPFDSMANTSTDGVTIYCSTNSGIKHQVYVTNGAGATVLNLVSSTTPNANAWNFIGFSMNEASATSGVMKTNGTTQTGLTVTYVSPSTNAATKPRLGATNAGGTETASTRLAFLALWTSAIGQTAIDNLYNEIKLARNYGF